MDPGKFPEINVKSNISPMSGRWQTRRTQNPVLARGCGFKSHLRYSPVGPRTKPTGCVNAPSFSERTPSSLSAQQSSSSRLACESERLRASADSQRNCYRTATGKATDPDLATVINAWNRFPEAVRAGIVAMVETTSGKGS